VIRPLLVLLAALAACAPAPPLSGEPVDPPERADEAADVAMGAWSEILLPPGREFEIPVILWFDVKCLEGTGGCREGRYFDSSWSCPEIQLVYRDTPSESALAHELLHAALDQLRGDADGDHLSPIWDRVDEVDERLRLAGL